ncbi:MAG TPA: NADH-ubiquinone oxidoreductase-F iron-sulfur binding region domain-containing protein [Cyclobacteriaceae bacterium]|nr:NADH-ubiquinone oxidoreductase-F iron-sulfur binding region domain-containing protein [Cyclobacteriaceae bacterium]HRJ82126.1 NADH-ubiquinone oxidoreductase-F iron-sulfur binding region domain-containing protein [Cyclobacteriaceae bacterium]
MSKNLSYLAGRKGVAKTLFEELGIAATESGTPSVEKMEALRKEFLVGKANVYGTATFYDFLKPENQGKKVYVCNGSACLCAGTQPALKYKLQKHFTEEEIGEMCCLGRCHENSAFHIAGKNYSGKAINSISEIKKNKTVVADKYNIASKGTAVLTQKFAGLEANYQILKDCLKKSVAELQTEIKTSGLRGRGGAGFPMAIKLESCRNTEADQRFIVCNADEGDPGAYSDRYLLEQQPHAVLLGMIIAGYLADASVGVLYIRAEYPESIEVIEKAIRDLHKHKFIGENIFGSGFSFQFKVIKAQGAYICGEETALLSSIEGQRPEVRVRPPYPAQQGLFNLPTVVNNVETLANLPFIMKNEGKAFAAIGTPKSTGTKLISLDGYFNKPGIYEVDMGTPLSVVVNELGGGFRLPVKAMHIGGPLGGLVPVSKINDLTIDFESFSKEGFLLGHASIVCIPEDFPLLLYIEHLFEFTAHESCGKCFPCRLGSTRGKEMLQKARTTDYKIDRALMDDLLETLEIGSLCMLGGGLPLPVKNALQHFEDELNPYFITKV